MRITYGVMMDHKYRNKVGFAVGTGRCGTQFLCRVMELEKKVVSVHERNILNEAFHRYCKWYGLPVDQEGFLHTKEQEIREDLKTNNFSFEASAPLALSVLDLYHRFGAKFILLVRSPEKVVDSYLRKGYFEKTYIIENPALALGYQETEKFHHFLGRTTPKGEDFIRWNAMTRRGKIAWFWNQVNASILQQFDQMPQTHWMVQKLEEFTYERYLRITEFLGLRSTVTKAQFESLSEDRPNALKNVPTVREWDKREIAEFETEVAPLAQEFGYIYSIAELKGKSKLMAM